jgi:hypothetical protein
MQLEGAAIPQEKSMFKDVCQYFVDLLHPKPEQTLVKEVDGYSYQVVPNANGIQIGPQIVKPHPRAPIAQPTLSVQTLSGLVDAYKAKIDEFPAKVGVHVIDHLTVALVSLAADEYGRRHEWVRAKCGEEAPFKFGEFQKTERFLIDLQSSFLPTENVIALQRIASSLSSESSISVQDDGFSQKVTVKTGGVTHSDVNVPARIDLYVYRTFREIDPVRGEFMSRMKGETGQMPVVTLMDIDAGKWKLSAMGLVKSYLAKNLPTEAVVIA